MNFLKKLAMVSLLMYNDVNLAEDITTYKYEVVQKDNHVIHVMQIDPSQYKVNIAKAVDRKTVLQIAENFNADIAVNAGFFKIGRNQDRIPAGSLIIQGIVHNIQNTDWPLVVIENGITSIKKENPQNLLKAAQAKNSRISLVSGYPLLINDGEINKDILKDNRTFSTDSHARTAFGITDHGMIVLAVVEHQYKRDLLSITAGEVQSFIMDNHEAISKKYNKPYQDITITELKEILKEEFASDGEIYGMTIKETAELMKNMGCKYAINLDGGGSSTLVIDKKVMNRTFGDKDENDGEKVLRAVSDAIIFTKK